MRLGNRTSILGLRLSFLKLRVLKAFPIAVAIMLMVSTVFMTGGILENNTAEIAEVAAQNIANTIITASPIENELDVSASVELSTWYKHWDLSSIDIDNTGPFSDSDDIMEIEKDTFQVILSFPEDPSGPKSNYIWYEGKYEPPPHPITCNGVECVAYDPTYGTEYQGEAIFYIEDVFDTLPISKADGGTQTIEIEGYFLSKVKFSTSCDITIKYGDYYVKKDGSKDYTSIQAAIDDPETTGKTVYVYGDTYNEQIIINKSINLVGSYENTYINGSGESFNDYMVKVTGDDVVISSFVIKNGYTGNDDDETDGLELDGCSNVIVTECEITNNNGRGVVIHNGANKSILRECSSHDNNGHLEDSKIKHGDGLVITDDNDDGTEYNYVMDSDFYNCDNFDSDGIVIKNGADYNKIENCHIYNINGDWSKGIDIVNKKSSCDGPLNNVIKDCDIHNVSGDYIAGIGIWNFFGVSGATSPTYNKVIGGEIHDIQGVGIALYSTYYNTMKDVTINDNYVGIWTLQTEYNTIENCEIYGNTDDEFIINPLIPASKSGGDAIYFDLSSDHNTVSYCNLHNNEGVGIYIGDLYELNLSGGASDGNIIEYCDIYNSEGGFLKDGAIVLSCAKGTIIRYCNIYDNLCNGLGAVSIFLSPSEPNEIYNCNFYNNTGNGIFLYLFAGYHHIYHNNFYCNEGYGVKIGTATGAIGNEIHYNNFAYNDGGDKEAFDGTLGDDNWANNSWEGHPPGEPYYIDRPPLYPDETDPAPQENFVPTKYIVVENTTCGLYKAIEDGIANAAADGIIKVIGSYTITNPIIIDKPLTLIGEGATIGYTGSDAAIKVQSANVNIDSFNIQNAGWEAADGILVTEGESVTINYCAIHGFTNGIHIMDDGVNVTYCDIYSNNNGVYFDGSANNNQITDCYIYDNLDGVEFSGSRAPQSNIIKLCLFEDNNNGAHFIGAYGNTIEYCSYFENTVNGVLMEGASQDNTIRKCWIKDNGIGISIEDTNAYSNNIKHNHFEGNSQNANDVSTDPNLNNWDDGNRGNYWDDYTGLDMDFDGIGETPYPIVGGDNEDRYPCGLLVGLNSPPYKPSDPNPSHEETDVDINADLSWTGGDPDEGDVVTYDVYFGDESPPPKVASSQSGTTYALDALEFETTYYWMIVAWDNHGASNTGEEWNFTTRDNHAPNEPSNPSPANGAKGVNIDKDLSWTGGDPDAGDVVTYDVYFGDESPPVIVSSGQSGATFALETLDYNKTYYWMIVAWDNHGASSTGEEWNFITEEKENQKPKAEIVKPKKAFYLDDQEVLPRLIRLALIIGDITIEANVTDEDSEIEKVEFYINGKLVNTSTEPNEDGLYTYLWTRDRIRLIHFFAVKIIAYDDAGNTDSDRIIVRKFL